MPANPNTLEHPIIDVDVHQRWRSPEEVVDHLPEKWRSYATGRTGGKTTALMPAGLTYPFHRGVNKRLEAVPEDGKGTSFPLMKEQYLDRYPSVEVVNLTFDIGQEVAQRNPEFSAALTTAMNDWVARTWLTYDPRMRTAIVVPTELPERAAAEIHRMAPNPKVTGVLIAWNPFGKPLGHPVYEPIWRAAEEEGLPIIIHGAAGETEGGLAQTTAGGLPGSRLEWHTLLQQPTLAHLASFVVHGTFEKFPGLKVLVLETGLAWIPNFFWRLDAHHQEMRAESDWVRRLPSEYLRDHVKFSTQPFELTPRKEQLIEFFEAFGGMDQLLCFSSDYPHWDADDPFYVASRLPKEWLPNLFAENARSMLRLLPVDSEQEVHA
ncbi:amidohydrolase family protein [Nesterenkonia haasae]|uniref:amidohydrolase family protein n=1 Tax=Nesterenkonia haasae TaxID=2587813 RepID=UPI001391F22C|nr:amidohydrolase family protein [Nesterenkonia haasae]NDK31974.1 amidohydrolase [Nesterenkonia haasae]